MSDIFISYSKKDHDLARLLASYLKAEGYSVWWDTSLLSGESFRKTIMTELGRARGTIVIWTENSINSDWVLSEAGRAHAERKLIPLKSKNLAHKDIPPPFDNMHIENVDDREKILAAVVAALAKPQEQQSSLHRLSSIAQYQLLSWFGIIGGAITLATNLHGALTLSKWIKLLFASWAAALQYIWSVVLFFLPYVNQIDALILTLVFLIILNLILASRRTKLQRQARTTTMEKAAVALPAGIIFAVFLIGLTYLVVWPLLTPGEWGSDSSETIFFFYYDMMDFFRGLMPHTGDGDRLGTIVWFGIAVLISLVIHLAPICALYYVSSRAFGLRLDSKMLASRLWRIVIGFAVLLLVNQIALWAESQPWLTKLSMLT